MLNTTHGPPRPCPVGMRGAEPAAKAQQGLTWVSPCLRNCAFFWLKTKWLATWLPSEQEMNLGTTESLSPSLTSFTAAISTARSS